MSESNFEKKKDSLVLNKIFRPAKYTKGYYQGKGLGEPYSFYYNLQLENSDIKLEYFYDIEGDELISMRFTFGTEFKDYVGERSFFTKKKCSPEKIEKLLNLYMQKYGEPDKNNDDERYVYWSKDNLLITFYKGIPEEYSSYRVSPQVEYSYTSDYEKVRQEKLKNKKNKNALDKI